MAEAGIRGSTQVFIAVITAIASVAVAWVTVNKEAGRATDVALDQRSSKVSDLEERLAAVGLLEQRLKAVDARASRLGDSLARIQNDFQRVRESLATSAQLVEDVAALQQQLAGVSGSLKRSQKLCSVYVDGGWRDSFIVPATWSPAQCSNFRDAVGTPPFWQLGCVSADHVNWGKPADANGQASFPAGNECGW